MIKLFTTRIEANDEDENVLFILKTFDELTCEIEFKSFLTNSNVSEILDAIKKGVALLELEN
jgi:hypothetical protein